MLTKFSVQGFKGFAKKITLDLSSPNDYQFNNKMIKDNVIKNALIYGKNSSGKSNLGFAIFDIVLNLTDQYCNIDQHYENYINLDQSDKQAEFWYEFSFDNIKIEYNYKKSSVHEIVKEILKVNEKVLISYDVNEPKKKIINIEGAENLNWKYLDTLCIVRYIANNTNLESNNPISLLMDFVNKMLWFRSVEAKSFIGLKNNPENMTDIIFKNNKLKEFELFLKDNNISLKLEELEDTFGKKEIGVVYKSGVAQFSKVASTGTKDLWLFYCWKIYFETLKFVFIDEFDANYHFDLSANIIKMMLDNPSLQTIVTTHNTYLLNNKITRPDCAFIMTPTSVIALSKTTDKELREAHNIEKLFREGHFTEE